MRYNGLTRRYFESAAGVGILAGPRVGRSAAGSRASGTWVQFDIALDAESIAGLDVAATTTRRGMRIAAARFLAFACPHTIAMAAWLVERSVGRPYCATLPESVQAIAAQFELPTEKLGRLLTIEDAWLAAGRAALGLAERGVTTS